MLKISVIDLGYNSTKLVTYNVKDDDSFGVQDQESIKAKLGEGLDEKGRLSKKPMSRTIEALKLFRDIIQLNPIKSVLPIATSAVREAQNRNEFLNEVYRETGLRFKILSEREEALYSYVGAIKSLQIPDSLFFDLGGGSLEIVYAEKFRIKKVISLPLGALRLTQQFNGKDGTFSAKNYKNMKRHIWNLLPNKKDLNISDDTKMVGVGGALRALARYDQKISRYPLDKIHNYEMKYKSISTMANQLDKMKSDEISKISVIGTSRSETIVAGSCVIKVLMEKYGFNELHVSNHGLREGTLSIFLESPKSFETRSLTPEQLRAVIALTKPSKEFQRSEGFIQNLISTKLLQDNEFQILTHAEKITLEKRPFNDPQSLFYSVIDQDIQLGHKEQLLLALSLVYARHTKTAEWLFTRFKPLLAQEDRVIMRKIASLIRLFKVLEQTKSKIELKRFDVDMAEIHIVQMKLLPKRLLQKTLREFEDAFNIHIICMIRPNVANAQSSILKL